ncbi:MAG: murein transglycosylase A [Alphaproteobacteria bacterium]
MLKTSLKYLSFGGLFLLTACFGFGGPDGTSFTDGVSLTALPYEQVPGWDKGNHVAALSALQKSCVSFMKQPDHRVVKAKKDRSVTAGEIADWKSLCPMISRLPMEDNDAMRSFLESWFQPYRVAQNDESEGLFTGYYEAELRGSRTRSARYSVPLYKKPKNLLEVKRADGKTAVGRSASGGQLVPYYTRTEIQRGALEGQGLEILWVDDEMDAFILHVQGSGKVIMDTGETIRVGYNGKNGHPYVSIGRVLVDRGEMTLSDASIQNIKKWMERNPSRKDALLNENPSYVFFRVLTESGPIGAQGVVLTPGRSLAVDSGLIPYGIPVWLDIEHPNVAKTKSKVFTKDDRLRRLMIAQDTGGAIRGGVRGDFFWGAGPIAADFAGRMKSRGEMYLLLPKERGAF